MSSAVGFHKAPFIKTTLVVVGGLSVAASLLDWRPLVGLGGLAQLTSSMQLWRLVTHHLVFCSSAELLLGSYALYEFRTFERRFGTAKFAAFACVVSGLATLLQLAVIVVSETMHTRTAIASGPYALIFALLVPYVQTIPITHTFRLFGVTISYKTYMYALLANLVAVSWPTSFWAAASGLCAGLLYWSDFGGMRAWRFPSAVRLFCERHILPFIATSSAHTLGWQQARGPNGVIAMLDANGRPIDRAQQAGWASGALRARPSVAPAVYRPPTDEQIQQIEMLGFGREQILQAMRRANNNEQRAINILLDEQAH